MVSTAKAPRTRSVLFTLLAADVAFAFQQTAVLPALPVVGQALSAPRIWTAWLLSGYLLVSSVVTPLIGKLADKRGKRRVLLGTLVLFLVGSVGAALSPNIGVLIGFRAVQGIGGAVFPMTFSIVRDTLPADRVGSTIGYLTGGFGVGTALGFGLGGLIAASLGWPFIFAVGAVPVAGAIALVAWLIPPSQRLPAGRLDLAGGAMLGGAFAAFLLALTLGPQLRWGSWQVVVLFVVAFVLFGLWLRHERVTPEPFVTLRVLRHRPVLLTNLATLAIGYGLFGTFFLVPHLVESTGSGAVAGGLVLVPAAVGQLVGGPLAGTVQRRLPAKWPFVAGMVVGALGIASVAGWHAHAWQLGVASLFIGLGVGLAISSSSTLVTALVPKEDTGVSTTFNSTLRRVGGGIGSQIGAAVLASAATGAYFIAFLVAAIVLIGGVVLASFLPRHV